MRISEQIFAAMLLSAVLFLPSCKFVSEILHDDDVVAEAVGYKLYRAELESVIPRGISSEDSLKLARQYIDNWASDYIFQAAAANTLSKEDLDVSEELEQYRRVLLKYRYEEKFVNERLDTAVTDTEIQNYYDENKQRYELSFPILRVRYVQISPDSPSLARITKLMSSPLETEEEQDELAALVATGAQKYSDFGGAWMDIRSLALEFGVDYGTLLSLKSGPEIRQVSDTGLLHYAYVLDYQRAGTIPPLAYCSDMIRETIVNSRKQETLLKLEQDLLEQARSNEDFVIF